MNLAITSPVNPVELCDTLTYTAGANGTISGTSPQTVDYKGWASILNDMQAWSQG